MTYKFGANWQCARRVDTVLPSFLDSANEVLSDEVTTLEEHREIFPLLMGWWLFTRSTAAAMIHLYRQDFTVEVKPLACNLFAHAFAMSWLVDNGPAAVQAVHTYLGKQQQSFASNLVEIKYPLPESRVIARTGSVRFVGLGCDVTSCTGVWRHVPGKQCRHGCR
ncbi:hypothetical protein ACFYSH_31965 [Streptomyces sp. NPDC005791]|uniref:hypothetical protein n=1 Tax=Streptomyces sp. NPDC005791 TaxID=3364732 RepID=UPI0036A6D088